MGTSPAFGHSSTLWSDTMTQLGWSSSPIRAEAKRDKAEIFFEDESGVRSDFHSGTTWAPKGKTPVVRVTGQRFSLNMMSAVSPRGELRFMVVRGGVGAGVFIEFFHRIPPNSTPTSLYGMT
jgi:DDE superfamily endonuclease